MIETIVRTRLEELRKTAAILSQGNAHGQIKSDSHAQECSAWLASAQTITHLICAERTPYRLRIDRLSDTPRGLLIHTVVGEVSAILGNLLIDVDAGLLVSIADQARAEVFDDFLDHAGAYLKDGRKNEGGVIAGVVFEDTIRKICRKFAIAEAGVKLDVLLSQLATQGALTALKAKRARASAHVRTKATHAQWNEFEIEDVKATIDFTRELVAAHLGV